ncbi:PAS domain S-box protein [Carboxylicivirga sediminis]|uniref:histidine kinase n=1 Tax=Carboxylicivirga sediminis TaxID=2006564 RepID=A0A941IW87_9BACT|nr:PAS domain S-box protein [Carboxylicivirga sediminis]MBR8534523.1 PAS domain S-box protein [Carboxylicivirga sediminis]
MQIRDELITALDYSESIVVLTDNRGMIRYVNNSFVEKYGYSREEVIGKTPRLFKSDYHDAIYYHNLWSTIKNGETWRGLFKNITKSGDFIWEKAVISPVKNDNGRLTGFIAVKEDITRQRELQLQLDRDNSFLDELFDNSPVGIAILQPIYEHDKVVDFRVTRANPSAGIVVGRLGLVGLKVSDILPDYKMDQERLAQVLSRKSSFESHLKDIGKHVRYRSFPFGKDNVCLFFYDVSPYRQTIQALEASEERYFSLVEDAPALISRFDKDGVLIYANEEYCKTFEVQREDLIGRNIYDWYPDEEKQRAKRTIKSLTAENPISVVEHQLVLEGGKTKWMRWLDRALVDSDGEIFEYQSVGMDLTPLKKSELELIQHRNKLDAVVNSTVAGIGVVSPDGRFVLVNERFQKMMGYDSKEEIYACEHLEFVHPRWAAIAEQNFQRLLSGEVNDYNLELEILRRDNTTFWGDLHVSPIKDVNGEIIEIIGIITDSTKKKETELQLKEREEKLKELNATKDKLFSIIAHDIKNPFNSILGFSGLLKNNLDNYSREEIKSYIEQIALSSENVYKLLDDLLIWAKSQLGQMTVNPQFFRLRNLVDMAFEQYTIQAENKQIELINQVQQMEVAYADLDMMKFVVRNLIHNAIKFTNPKGEVRCDAVIDGKFVILSVKDTGIGIRPEKIKTLFNISSYMTTSGTSEEKGTGLGLHLSLDMVEKNDGRIEVESEVGVGTEIKVYLPLTDQ